MNITQIVIAASAWLTLLIAIGTAWANVIAELAAIKTMLSERKEEIEKRFQAIEDRLEEAVPSAEMAIRVAEADKEHARLWGAIEVLKK